MHQLISKIHSYIFVAVIAFSISACTSLVSKSEVSVAASKSDEAFNVVADKIWQEYLADRPIASLYAGNDQKPNELPDMSEASILKKQQDLTSWLKTLKGFSAGELSEQTDLSRQAFIMRLQNELDGYRYLDHYDPLTSEGGFHSSVARLPASIQLKSTADIDNYLARLKALPVYFEQQMNWMRKGLQTGITVPKVVLAGYETSIDGLITDDPTDSVFYKPFKRELRFLDEQQKLQVRELAKQTIQQYVTQAYRDYRTFMVEEYRPNARETIGLSAIPNGLEYYKNRAKHYTTTELSPEQIHQMGLDEVKRIRAEMAEIIKQVGFEGTFAEFLAFLRNDPQFYAKTPKELLMTAAYISKKMDAELPKLFKHLPRTPYGVAPVPDHIAPKYTTGRYLSARTDKDSGTYWVNTYALDRRPLYEMEALSLHEAVPGHHLQIALAREMKDQPPYRNYYISAFGEGWGLYAEWLGLEVGFYQDPYSNFGRLTYEMWRALRLVVDTGMHVKGWTRQQAVQFMSENSALSEHNINTEVDRYISWPAQALSYKIGELVIKKLRKQAEAELGDKFDVREFHYHILKNGSVTLSQLEKQIEQYIQNELKGS